jgi:transcriptional regulator with XRE-family HTH domain
MLDCGKKEVNRMGVPNTLKEERQAKNMSQEELAAKSKVARTIISGLESGSLTVTTTGTLQKLAKALGKSVGEIFFNN